VEKQKGININLVMCLFYFSTKTLLVKLKQVANTLNAKVPYDGNLPKEVFSIKEELFYLLYLVKNQLKLHQKTLTNYKKIFK